MTPNFARTWKWRADVIPSSPFGLSCRGTAQAADLTERGLFDRQIPYLKAPIDWYGFGWRQGCVSSATAAQDEARRERQGFGANVQAALVADERSTRQKGGLAGCSCELKTLGGAFKQDRYLGGAFGALGAGARVASEEERRTWLLQIRELEADKAQGADPLMTSRGAWAISKELENYAPWEHEKFGWLSFKEAIPDSVNFNQRLAALIITAAPAGQYAPAIVENAVYVGARGAEEMSDADRAAADDRAVYSAAAEGAMNDPLGAARRQGWIPDLPAWQLGLGVLAVGGVALGLGSVLGLKILK